MDTKPKCVIAHRGASGYLPEHTLAAYSAAHAMGADFIEPDVVLSRDGVLLCLHDLFLESTTNAGALFPDRRRDDGHWYAADFTLEEIKRLSAHGRGTAMDRGEAAGSPVATLEELIQTVQNLNGSTGREVGLLIETKAPRFHSTAGTPIEEPLLELLARYGYQGRSSRALIQSFDAASLKRMRFELKTALPLVQLTPTSVSTRDIDEIATYGVGVAPNRGAFEDASGRPVGDHALVRQARERGLEVFVWTFNAEEAAMRRFLWDYGIDGVITNHPDVGRRAARPAAARCP